MCKSFLSLQKENKSPESLQNSKCFLLLSGIWSKVSSSLAETLNPPVTHNLTPKSVTSTSDLTLPTKPGTGNLCLLTRNSRQTQPVHTGYGNRSSEQNKSSNVRLFSAFVFCFRAAKSGPTDWMLVMDQSTSGMQVEHIGFHPAGYSQYFQRLHHSGDVCFKSTLLIQSLTLRQSHSCNHTNIGHNIIFRRLYYLHVDTLQCFPSLLRAIPICWQDSSIPS